MNTITQALQHATIWELCLIFFVVAELVMHYFVKKTPSGFEDPERGFITYQDECDKLKSELQIESDRADSLEEANQVMYDKGFSDGNLSAIKEIGKGMIDDHEKNIADLEELPTYGKMSKKSKQGRSKMIHKGGYKLNDMNVLSDFAEVKK